MGWRDRFLWSLAIAILGGGCAMVTKPVVQAPPPGRVASGTIPGGIRVLILPAEVSTVTAHSETPVTVAHFSHAAADQLLRDQAKTLLAGRKLSVVEIGDLAGEKKSKAAEFADGLRPNWSVLTSYYKDRRGLVSQLNQLRDTSGMDAAWVCRLRVNVGRSASWDPNSGAIAQSTSSTSLRVLLISLNTGEVLWANEVYSRDTASDSKLRELSDLIYRETKAGD